MKKNIFSVILILIAVSILAFLKPVFSLPLIFILSFAAFIFYSKYVKLFSQTGAYKAWLILSAVIVIFFSIGFVKNTISPVLAEEAQEQNIVQPSINAPAEIINNDAASAQFQSQKLSRERLNTPIKDRLMSVLGIFILLFICWLMSVNKRNINWRPVIWGICLQVIFGLIVISDTAGAFFFTVVDGAVGQLLAFSEEGAAFVFGKLAYGPVDPRGMGQGMFFFFAVLPTIIFFSSLMTLLYHIGLMGWIVKFFAKIMQKTMKTSGSESLSAAANIFVGQTEAPLLVKPFVDKMTVSELHAIMTGGFATVAGGVMAAYVIFLKDFIPNIAGHLVTASIMSAPAALAVSKIVYPETEESLTAGDLKIHIEKPDANMIEAAARGATEGMTLMLNVAAMLVAFVALIATVNFGLEKGSDITNAIFGKSQYAAVLPVEDISKIQKDDKLLIVKNEHKTYEYKIEEINAERNIVKTDKRIPEKFDNAEIKILRGGEVITEGKKLSASGGLFFVNLSILFGWIFAPISWAMGVAWSECSVVGRLLGEKLVLTEFIAYLNLSDVLRNGYETASGSIAFLSPRSAIIASYALCGFANFASIGIQIGGIGGIAPRRRADLARIGLRSMFAGAIAACLTGNIVGIFI